MTYEEFIGSLKEELGKRFGEGCQIRRETLQKNNGIPCDSLISTSPEWKAGPVLYLGELYQGFCAGQSVKELCEEIEKHLRVDLKAAPEEIIQGIPDFSRIKGRIMFRLVHAKKNQERLRSMVHCPFLDLTMEFCIFKEGEEGEMFYVTLSEKLMKKWGVDMEELSNQALKNMKKQFPAEVMSIEEAIMGEDINKGGAEFDSSRTLYILSNKKRMYGAGCILYEGVLKEFSDKFGRDILILPSSVHEMLLIPDEGGLKVAELEEMVESINRTVVSPKEVLSDKVYRYCRASGRIEFADGSYVYEEVV